MKLKIISDGDYSNTRVVNADTGEQVDGVVFASWECEVFEIATATLRLENIPVELIGETELEESEF